MKIIMAKYQVPGVAFGSWLKGYILDAFDMNCWIDLESYSK